MKSRRPAEPKSRRPALPGPTGPEIAPTGPISYHSSKFLDCSLSNPSEITLESLAEPFSRHLCEHIGHSPKQVIRRGSQFLDICRADNDGTATRDALLRATVKNGFNNVIDEFFFRS